MRRTASSVEGTRGVSAASMAYEDLFHHTTVEIEENGEKNCAKKN